MIHASSRRDLWSDIRAALHVGQIVETWSLANGYRGGSFAIPNIGPDQIVVNGGKIEGDRIITHAEFQNALEMWPDYRAGKFSRNTFRFASVNLTYIFSILRWHESLST